MTPARLAWRVEETCLNAWPALRQVLLDGWVLRFSEGLTRRANSVNPLRADHHDIDALIPACEGLYQRQRLPTIFRLPSIIEPALDRQLDALGYGTEGYSHVLYGDIDVVASARDPEVQLSPHPAPQWFRAMAALQNQSSEQSEIYRRIVGAIVIPAMFATLAIDREIVALAYGALHNGLLCYESVVVDPRRQRRGYGRRVIAALAAWAREEGASGACLQVEAGNAAALALYDRIGLKMLLYSYHYRREPAAAARHVTKM